MKSKTLGVSFALFIISSAVCVLPSRAGIVVWTNTAGGLWSAPANWNPNLVPASADDVFITNNGNYVVTLDASPSINSLTLGGAIGQQTLTNANNSLTLAGASVVNTNGVMDFAGGSFIANGPLTVSGIMNWQSAAWMPAGGVTVTASGELNIQNNLELYGALTNFGMVNWLGGYVRIWNDGATQTGVVWNQAGGVWTMQCDQPMYAGNGGEAFHNAGMLRKTGSLGTTTINDYLDNTGTVEARTGTIQLNGNSNLGGSFVADLNAVFNLEGNYTNGPATSLTGAGSFALTGGNATMTLQTNVIANLNLTGGTVFLDSTFQQGGITNLTLNGATLDASNFLTGTLALNGSTLDGWLTVLSGGVLNATNASVSGQVTVGGNGVFNFAGGSLNNTNSIIVGANGTLNILNTLYLYGALTNQGTVNWQTGHIYVYNDGATQTGAIWNQVNGTWNISVTGGYSIVGGTGSAQFHNASLLRQTAGIVTSYLQIYLDNSGTVEAQSGTLELLGGSNLGGTLQADANSVIDLGGLNYTNATALNLTGSGTIELYSGTLTLVTNPNPNLRLTGGTVLLDPAFQGGTITNLTLNGSTLGGTNVVTGTLTLNGGGTTGALTIATNGMLNIPGGSLYIEGLVTNLGAVNWTGGTVTVQNDGGGSSAGEIWNEAGAFWNIQCDQYMSDSYGGEQFHNLGVLRKTTSSGITTFYVYLDNSGTVEVQSGTIQFYGGSSLGGDFLAESAASVLFGNVNYSNTVPVNLGGAGTYQFVSGTITLYTNPVPNLQWTGGMILLDPSFQGGAITNLTLAGATLGGTNTVSGNLALNGGAITGALTVAPGGMLTIQGGQVNIGAFLTNQGTVNWTGGDVSVINNAGGYTGEIWNQAGAYWNIQCDQAISIYYGGEQFHNAGSLRKNTTYGLTSFDVYLDNSGTVEAQTGTIELGYGSNLGGSFVADAGATIGIGNAYYYYYYAGANYTNSVAISFSGAGAIQFNAGTFTLLTNTIPNLQFAGGMVLLDPSFQGGSITNLTLNGATLGGTNTVTGVFNLIGGTLGSGSVLTVAPGGVLNLAGSFVDFQGVVTNSGTVNWESGNIRLYDSSGVAMASDVWNQPGAVWNAYCDAQIYYEQGTEEFHNAGTFRKSTTVGQTTIQLLFDNLGLVDAQSGVIYFNAQPLTLEAGGALQVGINGLLDYGQIYLPGNLPLNGTFSASFNNGYLPEAGDSFIPVTYSTAESGAFTGLNLPSNDSWQTNYGPTSFILTVAQGLEMTPIPTQFVRGLSPFTVTAVVADSEVPPDSLTYSLVAPPGGMTIGASTGVINWTAPGTASTNTIVVNVADNDATAPLHASTSFDLIVVPSHANVAPVFPIATTNHVNELTLSTITNTASEADIYATLTYSLVSAPAGAAIDANGIVTWTPSQTQSHSTNVFVVAVTNTDPYAVTTHLGVTSNFTVVVHEVNTAPLLPVILTQTVNELNPLSVANTATEENIHATLAYGLINPPASMTINGSGVISWTPSQAQSPGTYLITTVVTNTDTFDPVNPHLIASNTFAVVVIEVNVAPVLAGISTQNVNELAQLTVNNAASEPNIHATTTSYSLVNPPAGAAVSPSGVITWTPSQTQSPGPYIIQTVVANSDPYDLVNPVLTTTNSFTVNVIEVNVAPAMPVIPSTNINESTLLTINDAATESNIHATITGYGLINPPATASISPSGVFTWTPSQNQSSNAYLITVVATNSDPLDTVHPVLKATNSFTVNVIEVNVAPVLPGIPSTNINETTLLNVTNTATETDIHATLAYGLVNPPAGMTINASGVINWTPAQNQSPGTNVVTTIVTNTDASDLVNPHLYATNSFTVVVKEVNNAPTLPVIPATNINELTLLSVTNTATETNIHATLAYFLVSPPAGMSIDANGVITWTPAQTQSPGTYLITNIVTNTDIFDTVNPHLAATNSFTVNVKEVNVAPVLPVIPPQTVNETTLLAVNDAATETNIHATLTYGLLNPPANATVNSSGVISFTPSQSQSPGAYIITNVVTSTDALDLINPHLYATNTITVTVKEVNVAPALAAIFASTNINELTLLTVTNAATDADIHATVAYALIGPPAGAAIDINGVITWTPAQTQSPGSYTITTAAISTDLSDNSDPVVASLNSFIVNVKEVNVAPVLPGIPTQTVNDLSLLTVTNTAAETNIHATLTYTLAGSPPQGMTISPGGVITWTPSPQQGHSTNVITTIVTNTDTFDLINPHYNATNTFQVIVYAPVLAPIADTNVNAGQTVAFTAAGGDNDASRTLTYSLVGAPAAASIGAGTGSFSWRPGIADANTAPTIIVKVTDNSVPQLSATQSFKVTVNPLTAVTLAAPTHTATQAQMQVTGPVGPDYILLGSPTLTSGSWIRLITNTPSVLPFTITDTNASPFSKRFYRIQLGP